MDHKVSGPHLTTLTHHGNPVYLHPTECLQAHRSGNRHEMGSIQNTEVLTFLNKFSSLESFPV